MAKLGRAIARWRQKIDGNFGGLVKEFALREDGVLLRRITYLKEDGSKDFSDGWKIAVRNTTGVNDVGNQLCKAGFRRVYR